MLCHGARSSTDPQEDVQHLKLAHHDKGVVRQQLPSGVALVEDAVRIGRYVYRSPVRDWREPAVVLECLTLGKAASGRRRRFPLGSWRDRDIVWQRSSTGRRGQSPPRTNMACRHCYVSDEPWEDGTRLTSVSVMTQQRRSSGNPSKRHPGSRRQRAPDSRRPKEDKSAALAEHLGALLVLLELSDACDLQKPAERNDLQINRKHRQHDFAEASTMTKSSSLYGAGGFTTSGKGDGCSKAASPQSASIQPHAVKVQ